jgi:hypothetical protein
MRYISNMYKETANSNQIFPRPAEYTASVDHTQHLLPLVSATADISGLPIALEWINPLSASVDER